MSDYGSGQPAGWYHAQGDPPGTQRYWDGAQWVGGPQAAQDAAAAPVASGGFAQPSFAGTGGIGNPASYGSRVVAVLIDGLIGFGIVAAALVLWLILSLLGDAMATIGFIIFLLAVFVGSFLFPIWNTIVRQGQTGQSIGKARQNSKLVSDQTGGPIGIGPSIVRALLGSLLTSICYLDLLWPLFDEQKKRLTDKILDLSVVDA